MQTLRERIVRHETANEDRGKAIKFSPEELFEVEILNGSKGSKGRYHPKLVRVLHHPKLRRTCRERGNRRKDGGGDWNVRSIGAAPHDSHPNFGDYRNSEGLMEGGYYEAREDRNNNFERRCVKAAKIEFPPFDGTTDEPMLWSCYKSVMTSLRTKEYSVMMRKLGWEEFKRICKSRFGKADAVNPVGELSNLRHTGTWDEYCTIEYARDNEYKIDSDKRTMTFGWVLLDTGSTHNFIKSSLVEDLGIPIHRKSGRWLNALGRVIWDGLNKTIEFHHNSTPVVWHGESKARGKPQVSLHALECDGEALDNWFSDEE
ncbi:hypothetical protein HID58_092205 [Brassica napus]|uniref:Uncharacterized protein n=1 Tax=Brassica napus TaxID=3708 RepID=A0ABQ7WZG5_BRANA|nr:hypothetical protein HID58_092205 [Brassica napus]